MFSFTALKVKIASTIIKSHNMLVCTRVSYWWQYSNRLMQGWKVFQTRNILIVTWMQ